MGQDCRKKKFHTPTRNHLSGRFPSFPLPLEKDNSLWSPLNCSSKKKSLLFTFFPINLFFLNLVLVNHLFLTLFQSRRQKTEKEQRESGIKKRTQVEAKNNGRFVLIFFCIIWTHTWNNHSIQRRLCKWSIDQRTIIFRFFETSSSIPIDPLLCQLCTVNNQWCKSFWNYGNFIKENVLWDQTHKWNSQMRFLNCENDVLPSGPHVHWDLLCDSKSHFWGVVRSFSYMSNWTIPERSSR